MSFEGEGGKGEEGNEFKELHAFAFEKDPQRLASDKGILFRMACGHALGQDRDDFPGHAADFQAEVDPVLLGVADGDAALGGGVKVDALHFGQFAQRLPQPSALHEPSICCPQDFLVDQLQSGDV